MTYFGLVLSVPPNNPVDLQSLKLIDFHLLRWSAQQRLFCVVGALTSMLKTSAPNPKTNWPSPEDHTEFVPRGRNRA